MKTILKALGILCVLILIGWAGLQIRPRAFVPAALPDSDAKTIPLPAGLPAPVERFYRTVYGDHVPVIETAVLTGRGVIRPFLNIPLPARFVFVHTAGKDYRHYY